MVPKFMKLMIAMMPLVCACGCLGFFCSDVGCVVDVLHIKVV